MMSGKTPAAKPKAPPVLKEEIRNPDEWNFVNAPNLCLRFDSFQVKEIARSILQGEIAGELSEEMYACITENCFYTLAQVIKNALLFMRSHNRRRFTIEDFKNGLVGSYRLDHLPSRIPLDDSLKFTLDYL